ncbi:CopG family transcriptional regulator [Clostridioides difficile]|uniref:ribbon-helix-helix domain-containing protein n=1 Tax=Clostridioides difficile TaxID=1496 RepID=UPI0012668E91|nr:CopG family transcriptional regulator [Clostridioides difficile]MDL5120588.1 CopG family transcriptional regulator [Clostridioides difficile]QFS33387.1 ribbon-helix-helix protein, CopG family [Clostridioides difficile]QIF80156.1 ribbon-helix-helix protein, CopG family [Clostridioides difficile]
MSTSVKIRKLSKSTVSNLNQLAKSNGMSRNEFLKRAVEKLVEDEDISRVDHLFEELINKNIEVLNLNTKVLSEFCNENVIDISRFIL